ncbi:hypothetical protein [Sphingomonas phyllosphaerae]|uniref:hypothetical protein n=1 Tax=Sphingomonas phyllosphaerae TaxID=257003 RepID=UPI0003B346D9|nr:hypothetical protein [Sphingomonas phyllosphaerae]
MTMTEAGALGFGLMVGWFLYFVNRYRTGEASFTDITTIIGAVGGAAVTRLFATRGTLFGAYGIGLALGFFSYLFMLIVLVAISKNFDADYFLDGRRRVVGARDVIPDGVRRATIAADEDTLPAPPPRGPTHAT